MIEIPLLGRKNPGLVALVDDADVRGPELPTTNRSYP